MATTENYVVEGMQQKRNNDQWMVTTFLFFIPNVVQFSNFFDCCIQNSDSNDTSKCQATYWKITKIRGTQSNVSIVAHIVKLTLKMEQNLLKTLTKY